MPASTARPLAPASVPLTRTEDDATEVARIDPRPDDAVLVQRARAGDRWAEEALYRRHAAPVSRVALRLTGDREDALDVLQDTFVTALERLGDLRDPTALGPWLRQIAVRHAHRRLRRRRLRRALGILDPGADSACAEVPGRAASPEDAAELRRVARALARAAVPARICWILRHVEGLTLPEVAGACGVSESTAKRRVAAAQRAVDEHLRTAGSLGSEVP